MKTSDATSRTRSKNENNRKRTLYNEGKATTE